MLGVPRDPLAYSSAALLLPCWPRGADTLPSVAHNAVFIGRIRRDCS